jgi:hypothetical protein
MTDTCKAVWNLQQVRDQILAGAWVQYDNRNDPGQLWSWGNNGSGRLGDDTIIHRSSPVQVPGTQWNDVSGGSSHSLARKTDGTLWSWGYNGFGRLGDGTIIHRSSPVQLPGTQWNDVSGGEFSFTSQKDRWYFMVLGK